MPSLKAFAIAVTLGLLPVSAVAQSAAPPSPTAEARAKVREACAAEVQKFCATIERAKGAMRTCLDSHAGELSDACKAARAEREAARAKDKS